MWKKRIQGSGLLPTDQRDMPSNLSFNHGNRVSLKLMMQNSTFSLGEVLGNTKVNRERCTEIAAVLHRGVEKKEDTLNSHLLESRALSTSNLHKPIQKQPAEHPASIHPFQDVCIHTAAVIIVNVSSLFIEYV